jgi:hypothetical protein
MKNLAAADSIGQARPALANARVQRQQFVVQLNIHS